MKLPQFRLVENFLGVDNPYENADVVNTLFSILSTVYTVDD